MQRVVTGEDEVSLDHVLGLAGRFHGEPALERIDRIAQMDQRDDVRFGQPDWPGRIVCHSTPSVSKIERTGGTRPKVLTAIAWVI